MGYTDKIDRILALCSDFSERDFARLAVTAADQASVSASDQAKIAKLCGLDAADPYAEDITGTCAECSAPYALARSALATAECSACGETVLDRCANCANDFRHEELDADRHCEDCSEMHERLRERERQEALAEDCARWRCPAWHSPTATCAASTPTRTCNSSFARRSTRARGR